MGFGLFGEMSDSEIPPTGEPIPMYRIQEEVMNHFLFCSLF